MENVENVQHFLGEDGQVLLQAFNVCNKVNISTFPINSWTSLQCNRGGT